MVKKAKRDPDETGTLRVASEPADATITIDGGEAHAADEKIELPIGMHLVVVSADGRKPYAALAELTTAAPYKIQLALDKESPLELAGTTSSAAIARKVQAALDPENLIDANTIVVTSQADQPKWYSHWYVWAGAALLVGGAVGTYEYMSASPTSLRGY